MRLRLGLLQDPAVIERQIQRELKEAEKKRIAHATPTVKTEEETKAFEALSKQERKEVEDQVKAAHKPPRIRPLSESKAIETGANFIAETFLFLVAGGLILAESWRRDRKEKKQDADVNDALATAEREREEMREKLELLQEEIEALMDKKPFNEVRVKAATSIRQIASTAHAPMENNGDLKRPTSNSEANSAASSPRVAGTEGTSGLETTSQPSTALASTESSTAKGLEENEQSTKRPSAINRLATSAPLDRTPTEGKGAPSSSASWLPSSWLGGRGAKPDSS
jgi:hypothetical protein